MSVLVLALVVGCHGLVPPPAHAIVRPFAPVGRYAGHWGVDVAQPIGSPVRAIGAGRVTFSGEVANNRTVTVDHGGGIRTSYSYLADRRVTAGVHLGPGAVVGISGMHDDTPAFHLSLRHGDRYLDPMLLARCHRSPAHGLWLAASHASYPHPRARHLRRYLRPTTPRSPRGGQRRPGPTRHRGRAIRPGR